MLQANQRVGEYVLDERIGQSALDEVWRAHHHMWSDQLAAVKVAVDPNYIANLRKDGIRVHRLAHPNIVRPIGFDSAATPPYLVGEYTPGGTLGTWIAQKKLTVAQAINVLRQILCAVQFSHEKGIIHGDLRPDNIHLDETAAAGDFAAEGSVKVSDFGVGVAAMATIAGESGGKMQSPESAVAYIAPENRGGAAPDAKSDIYAIGVMLFEMLTSERPTGADLPSELNPIVPKGLDDIFRKSYARRERRYETAKAFLDAVTAGDGSGAATAASAAPPPATVTMPPPLAAPGPLTAPPDLGLQPLDIAPSPKGPDALAYRPDSPLPTIKPPTPPPKPAAPQIMHQIEGMALSFQEDGGGLPLADEPMEIAGSQNIDLAPMNRSAHGELPLEHQPEPQTGGPDEAEQEEGPGETVELPPPPQAGPLTPTIPHVPSRAERNCLYDEVSKKQLRNAEDMQAAMRFFVDSRRLDEGELANIRLRVVKWADDQAGGQADLRDQITLLEAVARPMYVIKLLMRTTRGDEAPRSQTLEHPGGPSVEQKLGPEEYRLMLHLSADTINEKLLEMTPQPPLRSALGNMSRTVRREFVGRIQREDVLIYRANVIMASYRFDEHNYRVFMLGNLLRVVPLEEPFTRIRQEPTKRAAALLDGKQIDSGLKELRRGLESDQWQAKSSIILNALRGKLGAAYMVEAKSQYSQFLWLESLEMSSKAGRLAPSNEEALAHSVRVRKRTRQMQLIPGLLISAILIGLSIWSGFDVKPATAQMIVPAIATSPYFIAGIATLIATLVARAVLGIRMARTDFAFYQSMLLPIVVAGPLMVMQYDSPVEVIICLCVLVIGVLGDVLLFKYFREHMIRPAVESKLVGSGSLILDKIEAMLEKDWEMIRTHYLTLAPLYSFTSVQTLPGDIQFTEGTSKVRPSPVPRLPTRPPPQEEPEAIPVSGDSALGEQMMSRVDTAAKALAPPARILITLVGEYSKAMNTQQIGMMQASATKIEQRGKELAQKLADYDRLCKTPLPQDPALSERLSDRMNDPDVQLLRSLARCAKEFREDEKEAMNELAGIVDEAQQVIDRLKPA